MRRTAFQILSVAAIAVSGLVGCGGENPGQLPQGGTGGGGGITIIGPGGSGGSDGGSGGGAGGSGGQVPGASLRIDSIHPGFGTIDGGTRVTITGSGFIASVPDEAPGATTVVLFGGNPSIDARVVDDRTILATSPVGHLGDADVVVRNSSGEERCAGCFHYLPRLALSAIEPSAGHVNGGERITLLGEGLTEDVIVLFGGRAGLDPQRNEDGSLSVILPPGDEPGLVDVRVFSSARQSLLRRAFRYRTDLRIESIEPPVSPLAGGESVLLRGEGFSTSTRVFFGGVEASLRLGEAGLEVTVPRGSTPGAIRVEATDGVSTSSHPFAYLDPTASGVALYAVAPEQGSYEGGQVVTLLGNDLDAGGLAAYFGDLPALSVSVESRNLARAVSPPGDQGPVDVRVRNVEGMDTLPGAYRYVRAMALSSVEPSAGPVEGGTRITLQGGSFPANPRVFVGALEAAEVVRVSDERIEAVTPRGTEGSVPVRVIDAEAPETTITLRGAFTYEGPLSLAVVDPSIGARAGGTRVYIRGAGFRGEMKVFFGDNEAESVEVLDPHTIEAITPRGDTGLVDLRVEREDGAVAELDGAFNYFNPRSDYGGASGGPLSGVLNVTVIATSGPQENGPIEGCKVYVGADESTRLVKETDDRGQVTFSSPSLVKAVTLTVSCEHHELATVANQTSENVTVLLGYNGPPPPPPPPNPSEPPPPGILAGSVYGFKLPPSRPLQPNEREVALVNIAYPNIYGAPPFGQALDPIEIPFEGGVYTYQFPRGPFYGTIYAIYGIQNTETGAFEPLLMGYHRGVSVPLSEKVLDAHIVLDMRLDQEVPVTIQDPPWGSRDSVLVTAFMDLASDGVIPLGQATNSDDPEKALLVNLPHVSGESMIFQAWGHTQGTVPYSLSFRRQGGDPSQGVTIGPMLGPTTITEPFNIPGFAFPFNGTFEWEIEPGAEQPDVIHVRVYQPAVPPFQPDPIPEWHVVLPGNERRVTMPDAVLEALRARFETSTVLLVDLIGGSQPRFDFPEWNYLNISLGTFTNFTFHQIGIVP